jgi:hypothetical protein
MALGGLKPAGSRLCLLETLIAGAPEDYAAGYAPDRHRDVELVGNAQAVVFHALRRNFQTQTPTGGLAR